MHDTQLQGIALDVRLFPSRNAVSAGLAARQPSLRMPRQQSLLTALLSVPRISTEQSFYHPAVDIGEPKIPALKAVG